MIILPAADLLPATTTFKDDLRQLKTSLDSDDFPFRSIKSLLKTALTDESDDVLIWGEVYWAIADESRRRESGAFPTFANNVDGRQYFLRELAKVERTPDRETWTRMTRDLFHNLDHPLFDVKASFVAFLTDQKKELPLRCAKWALPVCAVLRQLAIEMRLAVDLVEYRNWDDGILKDALEALRYSIYDFLGPIAMILRDYCNANRDERYPGSARSGISRPHPLQTFGQVGDFCIKCLVNAELAYMSLMLRLSQGQAARDGVDAHEKTKLAELEPLGLFRDRVATPVANKVPTATFTELVIQNQSIISRRSIVTTLDDMNMVPATNRICMSFVHFFPCSS
jgi:hypothetical protein